MSGELRTLFPGLATTPYRITSPAELAYNCIAWAANDVTRRWWPVGEATIYWPPAVPRDETLEAFTALFLTLGYVVGADESLEPSYEKVALFSNAFEVPTHAARQLASGLWTSKIGKLEDIEHELRALEGATYGTVVLIMKRSRATQG